MGVDLLVARLCTRAWRFSASCRANPLEQTGQENGLCPVSTYSQRRRGQREAVDTDGSAHVSVDGQPGGKGCRRMSLPNL